MLDAPTIEHLVDAGMNVEEATIKAPEQSVAGFEKKFCQQLYKKKYPPKGHVYFRGDTYSLFEDNILIAFDRHAKSHK